MNPSWISFWKWYGKLMREYTVLVDPPVTMPAPAPVTQAPVRSRAPVTTPAPPVRTVTPAPRSAPVAASDVGTVRGNEYGPTGRNDTLWDIAAKVRPDEGVSMEQTMLGLLNANPEAFFRHNINNLKAGYVLRVPDRSELVAISQTDARAETRLQNQEWREGRTRPTATAGRTPASTAVASEAPAKLELTAPDETPVAGSGATAGAGESLGALRKELVLATEATEVQRRQTEEMEARLKALEEQITKMQRLIELKDDQLAILSGQVGEATVDTPVAAETPAAEESGEMPQPSETTVVPEEETGEAPVPEVAEEAEQPVDAEQVAQAPQVEAPEEVIMDEVIMEEVIESKPFEESQTLLDRIMANPLYLGAGALALALLVWLGVRRRSGEPEFQESILQEREARPTRASAPEVASAAVGASAAAVTSKTAEAESSLLSEFATSDLGSIQNQSEADPLAEADVYLAYGRYQQAEELIRGGLSAEPEREDLNLKLLEIYAAAQNRSGFDAHAQTLREGVETDSPLWEKVAEMGRDLSPDNPLYQPGGGGASAAVAAATGNDLDFDMDLGSSANTGEDFTSQEAPLDSMDLGEDLSSDLGLPDLDADSGMDTKPPAAEESNDLEFDLGDLNLDNELDDLEDLAAQPEVEEETGDGVLSGLDEVATKLDLARAYIDMGDPDGARSILDEVMEEGNAAQKDEAQGLLGQL